MPDTHVPTDTHLDGAIAASLAAWASQQASERRVFPEAARRIVRRALIDITGCMAAGTADITVATAGDGSRLLL